ncbi:MAG: hypothetical protein AB7O59_09710 [Pirellulales bacterium]
MAYEEQLERVRRYHARVAQIDGGFEATLPSENYVDDMYAFFQNCYHLKDWLKKDPAFTARPNKSAQDIEDVVTNTPCLKNLDAFTLATDCLQAWEAFVR